MKHILIATFLTILLCNARVGEHEKIKYKSFAIAIELPDRYGESKLIINCNRSSIGDFFEPDSNRFIITMRLETQIGRIDIPEIYFNELTDPDYPQISHFLTDQGRVIYIDLTGFDKKMRRCNLEIQIRDNKVVNKAISYINK